MVHNSLLSVGPLRALHTDGVSRIEADVDGVALWFETSDAVLEPAAEGFGTALLLPNMAQGRSLELADPVCPKWLGQLPQAMDLAHRWWRLPKVAPPIAACRKGAGLGMPASPHVGLLFTGGADSFFSLLKGPVHVDALIYVVDFDLTAAPTYRPSNYEGRFREAAKELGRRAIVVRSNLRRHPSFKWLSWPQLHGSALIAAAHLLQQSFGTLVVSSSNPRIRPNPWGSRWDLDPLWSSARLNVIHFGEAYLRHQKLSKIVENPVVRRHVRPCCENPPSGGNCSVCEKCLRTQIAIAATAPLDQFTAFDHSTPLAVRIDNLRRLKDPWLLPIWQDFLSTDQSIDVHASIAQLIKRSRPWLLYRRARSRLHWMVYFNRPQRW
jgi:hypothetical protein